MAARENRVTINRNSHSEDQTMSIAAEFARCVQQGDVIGLRGPLGAGKTCFVRGLVRGLGGDPTLVSSPTFVLSQEYPVGKDLTLIHIDCYRIGGADDLETIGWDEMLQRQDTIIAIEWPERIERELPQLRAIHIELAHVDHSDRSIDFTIVSHMCERFEPLVLRARRCATCGKPCTSDDPYFPFCSERCRYVDLGDWFDGKHRISRPIDSSDELTG